MDPVQLLCRDAAFLKMIINRFPLVTAGQHADICAFPPDEMEKDLLILFEIESTGDEILVLLFRDPCKAFRPVGGENEFIRGSCPFPDDGFVPDVNDGDAEADGFCRGDQFAGYVSGSAQDQVGGRERWFDIDGFTSGPYPVALDHRIGLEQRCAGQEAALCVPDHVQFDLTPADGSGKGAVFIDDHFGSGVTWCGALYSCDDRNGKCLPGVMCIVEQIYKEHRIIV